MALQLALIFHLLFASLMAGIIWFVQIVEYPLSDVTSTERFVEFEIKAFSLSSNQLREKRQCRDNHRSLSGEAICFYVIHIKYDLKGVRCLRLLLKVSQGW